MGVFVKAFRQNAESERVKVMKVNVKNMQRVKHVHDQRMVKNRRYWCSKCNYAWPRRIFYVHKSPGTLRPAYDFEQELINKVIAKNYSKLTVPALVELVRKRKPNLSGVSKMRKAELVSALQES